MGKRGVQVGRLIRDQDEEHGDLSIDHRHTERLTSLLAGRLLINDNRG